MAALQLAVTVSARALEICKEKLERGEHIEITRAFEQAFSEVHASRDDMVRAWAILSLALVATQEVAPTKPLEDDGAKPLSSTPGKL
jgi:hypothetical protein